MSTNQPLSDQGYTPTTEEVRSVWCAFSEYGGLVTRKQSTLWDDRLEEFDRWLAEVRRDAAEKAWNEGMDTGAANYYDVSEKDNPYRKEESK